MKIIPTHIKDLVEIHPKVFEDTRGYFLEEFNKDIFSQFNLPIDFPQTNLSFSIKGVLRGLHFQRHPYEQGKLVRVHSGKVLDVAIDLRRTSETFLQTYSTILSQNNKAMMYIPEGFAHGFLALEDSIFCYQCTTSYNPKSDSGIIWNDPDLNINWQLNKFNIENPLISEKDLRLSRLRDIIF